MGDFLKLTERIPTEFVKKPPQGKYGKYISHTDIQQIAYGKLGRPASFEVVDYVRGYIPAWQAKSGGKSNPERPQGIVACTARLTVVLDGAKYTIVEVGEANSPEVHSDGENLKTAASDAFKRCWMRLGVGLELWVEQGSNPSPYFLHAQLMKDSEERRLPSTSGSVPIPDRRSSNEPSKGPNAVPPDFEGGGLPSGDDALPLPPEDDPERPF